jgi:hypothetical protein
VRRIGANSARIRRNAACKSLPAEAIMKPFRTSLTARIVSLAIAVALAGTGILALTGAAALFPYVLLVGIMGCVVGVIVGAVEHTFAAMALVVALPLALWPYIMVAELAMHRLPIAGWAFIASGALVGSLTAFAGATVRTESARELAPAHT